MQIDLLEYADSSSSSCTLSQKIPLSVLSWLLCCAQLIAPNSISCKINSISVYIALPERARGTKNEVWPPDRRLLVLHIFLSFFIEIFYILHRNIFYFAQKYFIFCIEIFHPPSYLSPQKPISNTRATLIVARAHNLS